MTRSFNFSLLFLLVIGLLVFEGCRSTEEIAEAPEEVYQEPEPMEDDMDWLAEEEEEVVEDRIEQLNSIHFDFDKSDITNQAARLLATNVEKLRANPDVRVRIDAYTDHVGGDQYNVRLSVRRAESVANFYRSNGISSDRIETRGLGKHPIPCAPHEYDSFSPGCEKNRVADSHPLNPQRFAR